MDYRPRIRKGMVFLDNRMPGWRKQINVDVLDMCKPNFCLLGQLGRINNRDLDGYSFMKNFFQLTGQESAGLGFTVMPEVDQSFAALTDQWKEMLSPQRNPLVEVVSFSWMELCILKKLVSDFKDAQPSQGFHHPYLHDLEVKLCVAFNRLEVSLCEKEQTS